MKTCEDAGAVSMASKGTYFYFSISVREQFQSGDPPLCLLWYS